jgi:hypothetical protein
LLKNVHAAGSFKDPANLAQLKADTAFAPLTKREDFKKLLAQWEAETKSGK